MTRHLESMKFLVFTIIAILFSPIFFTIFTSILVMWDDLSLITNSGSCWVVWTEVTQSNHVQLCINKISINHHTHVLWLSTSNRWAPNCQYHPFKFQFHQPYKCVLVEHCACLLIVVKTIDLNFIVSNSSLIQSHLQGPFIFMCSSIFTLWVCCFEHGLMNRAA